MVRISTRLINRFSDARWVLAFILLFALFIRLKYFVGVFRFDSYFYAQIPYFSSQLDFHSFFYETNGYFAANRIVLLFPTGLLYRFFGVNDLSSVGFILFTSIISIIIIYFLGKKLVNQQVGLIAAFLLAIYPLEVINATQYLPDSLIPFFISAAALAFLYGEEESKSGKKQFFYYTCGLFIGMAQYVRENAFIFIFVLIAYALMKRKFRFEYVWILVGGATVFLLSGFFFLVNAGDFFYQINQLTTFYSTHPDYYDKYFSEATSSIYNWFRFTKMLLTDHLFRPFSLLIFISVIFSLLYRKGKISFVLVWTFTLLFYLEVVSQFHGMPKYDRYLSILNVPLVLVISYFLVTVYQNLKIKWFIYFGFLLFILWLSLGSISKEHRSLKSNQHFVNYRSIAQELKNIPRKEIHIQNLRQKGYIFNYIFDFNELDYNSFQREKVEGTKSLLRNWDGKKSPERDSYVLLDKQDFYDLVEKDWKLVAKKNQVALYYIPKRNQK